MPTSQIVTVIRRLLLATLWIGCIGTAAELLLLEHFEDRTQYIPLVILGLVLAALIWQALARSRASVRAVQLLMVATIVAGVTGVLLHYKGNVEFELEVTPTMAGFALFKAAMTGATPALAPGALVQLGLVGLAWAFRHPALTRSAYVAPHLHQEI